MRPKSSNLFHFTKNQEILHAILKNGFWPRYCLESINWLGGGGDEFVAFPMVCFCDIPLSRIDEHVAFYGSYGLGMTKAWATRNGLNPVVYFSGENTLTKAFNEIVWEVEHLRDARTEQFKENCRHVHSFIKPCEGKMIVNGKPVDKDFYQESEWRYAPRVNLVRAYLTYEDFQNTNSLSQHNNISRAHAMLKFTPQDIKYIFVQSDSDIPELVNFIQSELDKFPSADIKVLLSRITSLESMSGDI